MVERWCRGQWVRGVIMGELPRGTLTFLLTDIEGSTHLWEHQPEAMRRALLRHDALVEAQVTQRGGRVVKPRGEGDSRFAVFIRATDALTCAVALQLGLCRERWPPESQIRVRMALHTGEADLRDEDYFGPAVNRCARLREVAHGGQTLLSQVTCELVQDALPPGVSLRDLGEQRLRDLGRPERVFQLAHTALPDRFPPLRSLDALPNNLPIPTTRFIGRERELEALQQRVLHSDVRLLTLTGPGGSGKTRLALQLAAESVENFEHGVFFAPLAPVSDPALVASTVAHALRVRESEGRSTVDSVTDFLASRHLLLVLDNFEQVLDAASLLTTLLATCPRLKIVVTSRAVLRLSGEHDFAVPPLTLPDPRDPPPVERLLDYEAVRLFVDRAEAARAGFAVTANASAVVEICHRLDGLPLAIELAAVRTRFLPPRALLARLDRRLPLLTGGARDVAERHQTLRGTIAWSYDLLEPEEQALFRRLAIFVGGCTIEAAEAVCIGADTSVDVLVGMASLVDKSLLRLEETAGEPRFGMLETIREYATEQLELSGELEGARRRHAAYYRRLVEQADAELVGHLQAAWLERLESEHDNLRAVLRWTLEGDDVDQGLHVGARLWRFWWMHGYLTEGRQWLGAMLASGGNEVSSGPRTAARGMVLLGAGLLALWQGSYAPARAHLQEGLAIGWEIGEMRCAAYALAFLGRVARDQGDEDVARSLGEQGVALFRQVEEPWGLAVALHFLGLAVVRGEATAARPLFEESAELFRQLGNEWDLAMPLRGLGLVAYREGDLVAARAYFEDSLARFQERGDEWSRAMLLHDLAFVAQARHDRRGAAALFEASLTAWQKLGNTRGIASSLAGLAALAALEGEPERAARLFGTADAARQASGGVFEPTDNEAYAHGVAAARDALGDVAFTAAWMEGRAQPLSQAIVSALAVSTAPSSATDAPTTGIRTESVAATREPRRPDPLTRREREVARLVARGLTNRQIAEELVITEGTAINHVTHILNKLGFRSRAQVAAWSVEQGL